MKFKIRNFTDFINESYNNGFQRFYMLVKKPFPMDSENPLGKLIGEARSIMFDQITVTKSNADKIKLESSIPVLNFTEDNDLVEKLLNSKIVNKNCLYNNPSDSKLVSDKVSFHKQFSKSKYVPKTVFNIKDTKDLKFPIIAKPANGKSAEGIKKFDDIESLEKSDEKFDVFSETIDISKEFRCFCFKKDIIELNQRIKIKGSEDFLKDSSIKTNFYYKDVDPIKYEKSTEMDKLIKACIDIVNLEFFSIDFAEDSDGNLHLIEMNSRTGMGVDKMVKLYKFIYKDFYDKDVDTKSETLLKKLSDDWKKAYVKYKESPTLNECTVIAGKLDDTMFLFKNRDRSFTPDTKIIHEKISGVEVVYYTDQTGWIEGMNEHGVGFVFSDLTTTRYKGYDASYHVTDEPKKTSLTNYKPFAEKIKKVLTAKTVDSAIEYIISSKKSGNFLVGDTKKMIEIEIYEGDVKKKVLKLKELTIKTNHGILIPDAGHQPDGESIKRASTEIRRHQAEIQLQGIKTVQDIQPRMKFQAFDPKSSLNLFRTDNEEFTISQCLMDLTNLKFYFYHDKSTADDLKIEDKYKDGKIQISATIFE
jgi:hypothetical protein